ncbi:hypothetical protein [Mesorhizobium sp. B263B2A]|uniref:hypothetical protein n=1 Tax=Mesorhizobium sp. B263B2A TaxID=2876669 RepID=UPI001CD06958|nr:hypothetical protein [Mesorhizobium sp. B263B2A]MCA0032651.1 hypothetical protein [Mesorhizobium sp. B263B2A]
MRSRSTKHIPFLAVTCFVLTACGIHPLPDDVTGLSTYNIVRQIRCETRQAVIDSLFTYLTSEANHDAGKVDDRSRQIGLSFQQLYNTNPQTIRQFKPDALSGFSKVVIGLLWSTGIAYNFDLNMVIVNNVDPSMKILRTLPQSGFSLGLQGSFDRQRGNERSFTVTDNFGNLINKTDARYCKDKIVEANVVYPIAGKVGMERAVDDFLVLALFGNLAGSDSKDVTAVKGPPTMVDQLEFKTTVSGTVNPSVTFSPGGPDFHISEAALGVTNSRTDTHKLTVGLYLDTSGVKQIEKARADIFLGLITAAGGPAEQGAATAVDQFLKQKIFRGEN